MKVELSSYLKEVKPLVKSLVQRLSKRYGYVSVLGADDFGKIYAVSKSGVELNDSMWCQRGFVARVHNGINYSEYAFNELTEDSLDQVESAIDQTAKEMNEKMSKQDMPIHDYKLLEEEAIVQNFEAEVDLLPSMMSHGQKIKRLMSIREEALEKGTELIDVRLRYEEVQVSKIFISSKKDLAQSYIWTNGYIIPIGTKKGKTRYIYEAISGLKGPELLDTLAGNVDKAVNTLKDMLEALPMVPGDYDIILDPAMSGLVAHEAFGHGVEMDMFVKNRAKAVDYLEKPVASQKITMLDGAKSYDEVSSYLFDDEGVLGTSTKIIQSGILKSGISDVLSALTLGTQPTGNGKRQNFEHKAYARMTNTLFDQGSDTLEAMIASIDYGFLLEGYDSGMEDPKNWGIQCVSSRGREIKNGQLTGKIFAPVLLTGYVPDLLKSMSMVSGNLELKGNGACGKGHKELVKTSSGGPYIKARGRLS